LAQELFQRNHDTVQGTVNYRGERKIYRRKGKGRRRWTLRIGKVGEKMPPVEWMGDKNSFTPDRKEGKKGRYTFRG